MGVTEGGQWSLNVAMSVCWCMGFDIVYGDTDIIMFTIPIKVSMNRRYPMIPYMDSMMNERPKILLHTMSEYISGSSGCENTFPRKFYYMCNIMSRIINLIMSYTCMQHLKIEHQDNGSNIASGLKNSVYRRFIVFGKKHYVGGCYDVSTDEKGVLYFRRSGSKLKDYFFNKVYRLCIEDEYRRCDIYYTKFTKHLQHVQVGKL